MKRYRYQSENCKCSKHKCKCSSHDCCATFFFPREWRACLFREKEESECLKSQMDFMTQCARVEPIRLFPRSRLSSKLAFSVFHRLSTTELLPATFQKWNDGSPNLCVLKFDEYLVHTWMKINMAERPEDEVFSRNLQESLRELEKLGFPSTKRIVRRQFEIMSPI